MLGLLFFMDEQKLTQEFRVIELEDENGSLIFRIEVAVKIGDEIEHAWCLVDMKDRDEAYAFADRLNKHWDDIYEIPRWAKMFTEMYMTEKGLTNADA